MIICSHCKNEDYHGTLYCTECGAMFVSQSQNNIETSIHTSNSQHFQTAVQPPQSTPRYETAPEANIAFFLVDENIYLPSVAQPEFTFGRETLGQVIAPDIDLSDYEAYEKGVSRLHATIKLSNNKSRAYIVDLDSANGTRVNGNRIPANSEVPLHDNDIIALGKLKIQVVITH